MAGLGKETAKPGQTKVLSGLIVDGPTKVRDDPWRLDPALKLLGRAPLLSPISIR